MSGRSSARMAVFIIVALLGSLLPTAMLAATPGSATLDPPQGDGTTTVTWTGGPYTMASPHSALCLPADVNVNCDTFSFTINAPPDFWETHEGKGVVVEIKWAKTSDDFDLFVYDAQGGLVDDSAEGGTDFERVELGKLAPGTYTVRVNAFLTAAATYAGSVSLSSISLPQAMIFQETKQDIMDRLTVDYPVNVIFVGYKPTAAEVAELRQWIPDTYKPTIGNKSPAGDELQNSQAGLLNWNKNRLINSMPYFLGIRYNYKLNIIQASDDYARALFQVAEDNTAQGQAYKTSSRGEDQARYDALNGQYRVLAKNGDLSYKVTEPTKTDLIDAYAVEDWIFNSRYDARWQCAFTNLETGACLDPSIIQPDTTAYHDPFYDKYGLNLDRMPQGLNKGSSYFFLDTFTPDYAKDYFRPNAYHTYGTDKVIGGAIVDKPVEQGGSWRITDPDTGGWDGVDFGRTWGGRYRFHFVDLGAAPNTFEGITWLGRERQYSSDYPHGDPPIWQYQADERWKQPGDECAADPQATGYTGGTPCRIMPRLGRDVAYGLFFRSTAGYLYRPIPRADVNWLATSTWTDFYSRPQWVEGQLTNAPWYGTWWTNTDALYKINQAGDNGDDVLRWLSSAVPYTRWVGRKGEVIQIYDPTNNQPTGQVLDTSPKYADLPAPKYHVILNGAVYPTDPTLANLAPEPLYPGDDKQVIAQYGPSQVNLTEISNAIEKAKARGIGLGYDDSVSHTLMRDYIDANRAGIADIVMGTNGVTEFPLLNTIPSINMVFEKAYTWALPAIVGGIAVETADGEAWGVMNNVNDRFKWSGAHYPAVQPGDAPGSKRSLTSASLPTQDSGTGFSYTVEHEAAHNLGLSHPHDGSYGVDRCPEDHPDPARRGKWDCYWSGLGYMYDISAAPTTYAMSYRPYEVEDQDNLQRGHVAEYLVGAQEALRARLINEYRAGATTPSAAFNADYARMREWRDLAAGLFRDGDYLHAEYAARNASLAARGFPQTAANTSEPRLVEAGQVFYFNVNPQRPPQAQPDLVITDVVASQARAKETVLTATVANTGNAPASSVVVRFADGSIGIADSAPVASLPAGSAANISITWNTKGISGDRRIVAYADPAGLVAESNEANNQAQRTITIRGNKVTNGSFEQSSTGAAPDGWSGTQNTSYDTSGANASDGTRSAGVTGTGSAASLLAPAWTSAPIAVAPGETYNLAMTVTTRGVSSAPGLQVTYLDLTGKVLSSVMGVTTNIAGDMLAQQVTGKITIPAGVSRIRLTLAGFSPTDLSTRGTVWFDDVWMW